MLTQRQEGRQGQARAVRSTLATTLSLQALGLVSGALVARMLGVEDRGVLAAVVLWPALIANVGDLGGPTAVAYRAAKAQTELARLQGTALTLGAVQSVVLMGLGVPILALGLSQYDDYLMTAITFLLIYIPLNLISRYANAINQGTGLFGAFNAVRITVQLVYVVGVAALYLADRISITTVLIVVLAANAAATVVAVASRAFLDRRLIVDRGLARSLMQYGRRAQLGVLTPVDSLQLDLAALVLLSSSYETGLYAVALAGAMVVRAHGISIGMVALRVVGADPTEAQGPAAARLIRLAVFATAATAVLVAFTAPVVVPLLFGEVFAPAVLPLQILALGAWAASVRQVAGDCLRGLGRPTIPSYAELGSLVVAIPAFAIIVPPLGATGAALVATGAYLTGLTACTFALRRSGIRFADMFVPKRTDLSHLRSAIRPSPPRPASTNS